MSQQTVVLAQLEVENCTAELFLNGIPITRIAPPKLNIENVAVEQYLVPGENKLEVLVEPGTRPSVARSEQREIPFRQMHATARLIRFRDGVEARAEHGDVLGEVTWRWRTSPPDTRVFPQSLSTKIDMGAAHGRWAWQDAPVLTMTSALVDEACTLLDEVELNFRMAHTDGLWRLTELQSQEVRRAYPAITEGMLRAELKELMDHYQTAADPVMPRDRDAHDFRLVAGGRMLQLLDRDYTTSFKLRDPGDESPVSYRLMLARIDAALRIVR